MPIGIERLNARRQQPNSRITFIKPLPGETSAYAQDFLERIAAICHPIMKTNHISVMSLEEYEPNPEFAGRNFNAGEIIQLVLRTRGNGQWLSFRSVQMVMKITLFPSSFYSSFSSTSSDDAPRVHELAHCIQMNHSKAFWAVRNQYAGELRQLWQKGYTGDGFWGRGKTMLSDRYETTGPSHSEYLPSSLCGGTYRTWRGRKRKRGQGITSTSELSYKERQQRRIIKKFGTNGISLGDDEETRVKLEYGKRQKAKPRVANSTRGRELRAAAALARFEGKKEEAMKGDESQPGSDEADSESGDDIGPPPNPAVDCDGAKLVDSEGNQMIRVCENDNNEEDPDVKKETQELQELEQNNSASEVASFEQASIEGSVNASRPQECVSPPQHGFDELINNDAGSSCPICTMHNESDSLYCQACSHVLMPDKTSGSWRCRSENCSGSSFINRADTSRCGVCNVRKED